MRDLIEQERVLAGVPGCAVVVVRDGEVLLCDGFGHRDVDADLPVTTQTLFPLGSATKTFTALLLCRLAEQGALDLDEPLAGMVDPVTLRDCLSHRSGLPRHDLVWLAAEGHVTREEVVQSLPHLPASRPFRSAYQYNNLLYILAGQYTGETFEQALSTELLKPLGMSRSNVSSELTEHDHDRATPYGEGPTPLSRVSLDLAGPAGSLNSCADDLARWLLALTGDEAALTEMRRPHIERPVVGSAGPFSDPAYGLGLMLETYRGRRISFHGGNIDGFSSQVLTRDDGVGIAVLTNLHTTSLRDSLPFQLLDLLDGVDVPPESHRSFFAERLATTLAPLRPCPSPATVTSSDLTSYAGRFNHPGYGDIEVSVRDDELQWQYRRLTGRMSVATDGTVLATFPFFGAESTVEGAFVGTGTRTLRLRLEPEVDPIEFREMSTC